MKSRFRYRGNRRLCPRANDPAENKMEWRGQLSARRKRSKGVFVRFSHCRRTTSAFGSTPHRCHPVGVGVTRQLRRFFAQRLIPQQSPQESKQGLES